MVLSLFLGAVMASGVTPFPGQVMELPLKTEAGRCKAVSWWGGQVDESLLSQAERQELEVFEKELVAPWEKGDD